MENVRTLELNYPIPQLDYTAIQLILPLELEKKIDKNDPVRSFCEVMEGVNLRKYIQVSQKGRQDYNPFTMMKLILFAYMNHVTSLREIEERCRPDIRFMWLAEETTPSFMAFQRFINKHLTKEIGMIMTEINEIIQKKDSVNTRILYIDGTKLEANANKFSFIWKKTAEKTREKTSEVLKKEIQKLNEEKEVTLSIRREITPAYIDEILACLDEYFEEDFVYGKGRRKSSYQRIYDELRKQNNILKECVERIQKCGPNRNSCSKTDNDATMMHMKEDYYMKTGIFKAGYNIQVGVCDEYVWHVMVSQERSDQKTYIPFMESYHRRNKEYPALVVADAGYGSYDNYWYCLLKGITGYIKYGNYRLEKTRQFQKNQFRKENLLHEENGNWVCPNKKKFIYKRDSESNTTKYLSISQEFECEDCTGCSIKSKCTKSKENRRISFNRVLEEFKANAKEVLDSPVGIELRIQRSIQAEGVFGILKNNWGYTRIHRRGIENVETEITLVCIGFNLMKYHQRKLSKTLS